MSDLAENWNIYSSLHMLAAKCIAYFWGLKQFNCAWIGKLLKNPWVFLHIRRHGGGGRQQRRLKSNLADSIYCEELIFQFSAKSDNIYYVFPQNSQNHSFILPPPLYVMHRNIIFFVSVKPFYTITLKIQILDSMQLLRYMGY